jgi:hypothetical protein
MLFGHLSTAKGPLVGFNKNSLRIWALILKTDPLPSVEKPSRALPQNQGDEGSLDMILSTMLGGKPSSKPSR